MRETLDLINNYEELDWFVEKLLHDKQKSEAKNKLHLFEVINWAEAAKVKSNGAAITKWKRDLIDITNSELVEKKISFFDNIRKDSKRPNTFFESIKESIH